MLDVITLVDIHGGILENRSIIYITLLVREISGSLRNLCMATCAKLQARRGGTTIGIWIANEYHIYAIILKLLCTELLQLTLGQSERNET